MLQYGEENKLSIPNVYLQICKANTNSLPDQANISAHIKLDDI